MKWRFMPVLVFLASGLIYNNLATAVQAQPMNGAANPAHQTLAIATLVNPQGEIIGVATFTEGSQGVNVAVNIHSLEPGFHGFHIHETGRCDTPDFQSAGGHFNPLDQEHGLMDPAGPHAGDLPNLLVDPDGIGQAVTLAPRVTLGAGRNSLLAGDGTALVIHAEADDHMTDPAGDAGDRVACGVIRPASR